MRKAQGVNMGFLPCENPWKMKIIRLFFVCQNCSERYTLEDKYGTYKSPILKGTWSSKPPWLCSMLIFQRVMIQWSLVHFSMVGTKDHWPSFRFACWWGTQILLQQRYIWKGKIAPENCRILAILLVTFLWWLSGPLDIFKWSHVTCNCGIKRSRTESQLKNAKDFLMHFLCRLTFFGDSPVVFFFSGANTPLGAAHTESAAWKGSRGADRVVVSPLFV